jgi:hypothetical protein
MKTITSTAKSQKATNFHQLMVMGGKVCERLALHLFGFVFLQVMGDTVVIMASSFHGGARCWL